MYIYIFIIHAGKINLAGVLHCEYTCTATLGCFGTVFQLCFHYDLHLSRLLPRFFDILHVLLLPGSFYTEWEQIKFDNNG